jgi:hypothetical protein
MLTFFAKAAGSIEGNPVPGTKSPPSAGNNSNQSIWQLLPSYDSLGQLWQLP